MAHLDAQKVMAHVNEVYRREAQHGPVNVQQAMFSAVVAWDMKLRGDFTTGMSPDENEVLPDLWQQP